MKPTLNEIEDLERFFKTANTPKELQLSHLITIKDTPQFVLEILSALKSGIDEDAVAEAMYIDLCEIKRIIESENIKSQ